MSYPEMAADVRETIESLGVGPVALVGHSMGGKTAMLTALQYPQVVERLVVVDAAPVEYPPAFVEYAQAMRNADLLLDCPPRRGGRATGRRRTHARDPCVSPAELDPRC